MLFNYVKVINYEFNEGCRNVFLPQWCRHEIHRQTAREHDTPSLTCTTNHDEGSLFMSTVVVILAKEDGVELKFLNKIKRSLVFWKKGLMVNYVL